MGKSVNYRRIIIYLLGLLSLALGLTLNPKTGLGTGAVSTIPLTLSRLWGLNFAAMTFAIYMAYVILQYCLRKDRSWRMFLQIPLSVVFTSAMNLFGKLFDLHPAAMWQRCVLLVIAVLFSGVGVALSVGMHLLPNPADGMAETLGIITGRGTGTGKNLLDFFCVGVSILLMLIFGWTDAVGIGTVFAMIATGRIIAVVNHFFGKQLDAVSSIPLLR